MGPNRRHYQGIGMLEVFESREIFCGIKTQLSSIGSISVRLLGNVSRMRDASLKEEVERLGEVVGSQD